MSSPTSDRRFGLVGNTPYKAPAAVVATTNITQSGEQTIDGIAVKASNSAGVSDRVLCVGMTDATKNGLWDVQTSAWTRSVDADGNYDLTQGSQVLIIGGTYAFQAWVLTTAPPITIGTTALSWSPEASAAPSITGLVKNAKRDFNCKFDGVTNDTTNLQTAITTCENAGWALEMPEGTAIVTATLVQLKVLHLFGRGMTQTVIQSSAAEAYRVAPAAGSGLVGCYWHDFTINPSANGGGTNGFVMRLVSDPVCYLSNWVMERVRIGDFGGYGINLDNGVANLNSFFTSTIRRCWITNGLILNRVGDSFNVEENTITDGPTIQAAKIGGRIGILYTGITGARQVVIRSNNITTSGGALAAINGDQLHFLNNQCEQPVYYYIPYYANDPTGVGVYGAQVYLYNCYSPVLQGNTFGAGSITTTPATGSTTSGSLSVTGLSVATNIYKGCTVRGVGIQANTRVQSIVGTTVTLTKTATANGTPTLTFGYSADSAIFLDGGTVNAAILNGDCTSGTYYHYTISSGSYNNNTYGNISYAGVSTTATVNDQNTGASYNSIEDPASAYPQGNLFYNPFIDIWNGTDPTNTFAAGFSAAGSATAFRTTGTVYPGNPSQVSLSVTAPNSGSGGNTINNGVLITPANQPWRETGWISGCIAIYANNNTTGKGLVFFNNGATVTQVGSTSVSGGWSLIRFRCRITAGNNWSVQVAIGDGAGAYTPLSQIYIGGVHLCRGPYMPATIEEAPSRRGLVLGNNAANFTPTFPGQHCYVTIAGTGTTFFSVNATSTGDWKQINPAST